MKKVKVVLKWLHKYMAFFGLTAFMVTCCMLLFLSAFSSRLEINFTEENIGAAARLTFGNVLILSFLFSVIDAVRRKFTVDKPVKRITDAAQKITQGDFSVRLKHENGLITDDKFNEIIDCFNKMAKELGGLETLRTDFIANVSHEMKTPIAVMQNYGTLLQTPGLTEEKRIKYKILRQ